MGTAHSAYPLTSPNLNKTRPALCKTKGNSIQRSHRQQQITMGTAHSTHPLTSPSLNQTMRTLWRTPRKLIPTLTPTTANHTVHRSLITAWKNLREEGIRTRCWTRSERDGNEFQALHLATFPFFCPNHKSLVKTRCFTACLKSRAPVSVFFLTLSLPLFYSSLLCFSSFQHCRTFGS